MNGGDALGSCRRRVEAYTAAGQTLQPMRSDFRPDARPP
jgi:hypothetical protein